MSLAVPCPIMFTVKNFIIIHNKYFELRHFHSISLDYIESEQEHLEFKLHIIMVGGGCCVDSSYSVSLTLNALHKAFKHAAAVTHSSQMNVAHERRNSAN